MAFLSLSLFILQLCARPLLQTHAPFLSFTLSFLLSLYFPFFFLYVYLIFVFSLSPFLFLPFFLFPFLFSLPLSCSFSIYRFLFFISFFLSSEPSALSHSLSPIPFLFTVNGLKHQRVKELCPVHATHCLN